MTFTEWINSNYGLIALIAIVIAVAAQRSWKKYKEKKKKKEEESTELLSIKNYSSAPDYDAALLDLEDTALFDETSSKDALSSLKKQRALAKKHIERIKEEGKKLKQDEAEWIQEHQNKLLFFRRKRSELGMKYESWIVQLKMMDDMIMRQEKIK
jgi:hypothetical protein